MKYPGFIENLATRLMRWVRINSQKKIRIGLLAFPALVSAGQVKPMAAERAVQVRGQDSIIEELNMGPASTDFWRRLQKLINNPDYLDDFSKIVDILNLTIDRPVNFITPKTAGYVSRRDARDEYYRDISFISYGISKDQYDSGIRLIGLTLQIDISQICIAASEVHRIFGAGYISVMTLGISRPEVVAEPEGFRFFESYGESVEKIRRSPVHFAFSPGGCLYEVDLQKII
ncbi:hypothetical protein AAB992_29055 [Burkholderia contaminans]|uniref:hypothetical protein n=1 Tax=Burkholderia contaminans TaxID=488447 RepID=UPI0024169757|nr:hypothetical protein [Burkholderia contaminans]WFN14202.1 hypothetical protein LXE92_35315 [Burkholderia contaminans]